MALDGRQTLCHPASPQIQCHSPDTANPQSCRRDEGGGDSAPTRKPASRIPKKSSCRRHIADKVGVRGQARSYTGALACIRMLIMRNVAFTAAIT